MVAISDRLPEMSPQEYLEWEEQQPIKHEYVNGYVYAMAGGTIPHNIIAVNLTNALKNHLKGKGCLVLSADAKLGISEQGPFHYPDVMVTCDERDRKAIKMVRYPCLIVEVFSPSTEARDRGDKFTHYRRISTLKEYVLISADSLSVECYRLNDRGKWELTHYSLEESTLSETELEINLTSVDFSCPISQLYENTEWRNAAVDRVTAERERQMAARAVAMENLNRNVERAARTAEAAGLELEKSMRKAEVDRAEIDRIVEYLMGKNSNSGSPTS
ncbi:MAG: Uma2 family endonuclease [Hormoscilla sp. GM7CHS1pb]|nr:Uma2 family endonuclease [Hormoscilla sp. GM7CHS1pb]